MAAKKKSLNLDDAASAADDIDVHANVISLTNIMFRVLRHNGTEAGHFRDIRDAIAHERQLHRRGQVIVTCDK